MCVIKNSYRISHKIFYEVQNFTRQPQDAVRNLKNSGIPASRAETAQNGQKTPKNRFGTQKPLQVYYRGSTFLEKVRNELRVDPPRLKPRNRVEKILCF